MRLVPSGHIIPGANIDTSGAVPAGLVGPVYGAHLQLQATVDKSPTIPRLRFVLSFDVLRELDVSR